jgi:hypothetical protein
VTLRMIAAACVMVQAIGCAHQTAERTPAAPPSRMVDTPASPTPVQPSRTEPPDRARAVEKKTPVVKDKQSTATSDRVPERKLESPNESGTGIETLAPPPPLKPPTFGGAGGSVMGGHARSGPLPTVTEHSAGRRPGEGGSWPPSLRSAAHGWIQAADLLIRATRAAVSPPVCWSRWNPPRVASLRLRTTRPGDGQTRRGCRAGSSGANDETGSGRSDSREYPGSRRCSVVATVRSEDGGGTVIRRHRARVACADTLTCAYATCLSPGGCDQAVRTGFR